MGEKKKKRGVDVDLINQGVLINLAQAARIINMRHATRNPNAISIFLLYSARF